MYPCFSLTCYLLFRQRVGFKEQLKRRVLVSNNGLNTPAFIRSSSSSYQDEVEDVSSLTVVVWETEDETSAS